MGKYKVLLPGFARRQLRVLPSDVISRILRRLDELENDPFHYIEGKLRGEEGFKTRVGDYRITFVVDTERREVIIARIGHRRDVYDR